MVFYIFYIHIVSPRFTSRDMFLSVSYSPLESMNFVTQRSKKLGALLIR